MDSLGNPFSERPASAHFKVDEFKDRNSDPMDIDSSQSFTELVYNGHTVQACVLAVPPPPAFNLQVTHADTEHQDRATYDIKNAQAFEEIAASRDDSGVGFGNDPFIEYKTSGEPKPNITVTFMDNISSHNSPVSKITRKPVWRFAPAGTTNNGVFMNQAAPPPAIQLTPGQSSNGPPEVSQSVNGPFFYAVAGAPVQAPLPARVRPAALACAQAGQLQTDRPQTPEMPKRSLSEIYLIVEKERALQYNNRGLLRSEYFQCPFTQM
jgi:hypothetical protein